MRSVTTRSPPASAHRGRAGYADHDRPVDLEGEQGAPHRHAANKVLRAVHRVDHPAAPGVADEPLFLAQNRVAGPGLRQPFADHRLHRGVGVGHRGGVGLGLDQQVHRLETGHRDGVGGIRESQGQGEIVGHRMVVDSRVRRVFGYTGRHAAVNGIRFCLCGMGHAASVPGRGCRGGGRHRRISPLAAVTVRKGWSRLT